MPQTKWTKEFLNKMRETGDPPADKVAEILWKNRNRNIMEDLKEISKNHHLHVKDSLKKLNLEVPLTDEEIKTIDDYFDIADKISESITEKDKEYFKKSSDIFFKYGFTMTSLLFFKSLPTGYMCPKPGHVLHTTKLLEQFAARRVMETAQFVFSVNKDNWYEHDSPGMESIMKVRLMHAGMRVALLHDNRPGKEWDESFGIPINQEDLNLTNLLFSLATIQGLDQLGIHLFEDERHAVFHTWQKIGQAMGVSPELYTENYQDCWNQYHAILKRQVSTENPAGPHLTHALLNAMNEITHMDIPMDTLEDVTRYFLNDKRSSKSLGLHKPSLLDNILMPILHFILSLKIWQRLFHHESHGIVHRIFKKTANWFMVKKFKLGNYSKKYPGSTPLEAFSKVVLSELANRDMQNFEKMSPGEQKKKFFIDSKLYLAWDLGSFNLSVDPDK